MRLALAAVVTTVVPTLVGARWIDGPRSVRYGLGALLGVMFVGLGGMIGGLINAFAPAVVVACGAAWVLGPRFRFTVHREQAEISARTTRVVLFVIAVGCSLALLARFRPIPAWDGWMNWSIKAKALAFDGHFYGPVFKASVFNYSHQDYPPLLPAWQALAYVISGEPAISWPLQFQLAWFWTAGAVALVSLASRHWGGASLFMLAWVCAPQVLYWTMAGYADVPLAFFLVAGVAVLLLSTDQSPVVAGLLLGACSLSKNEGLPVALMAVLGVALFAANRKAPLEALAILLGIRSVWFIFTSVTGMSNDVLNEASLRPERFLTLIPRIIPIGEAWMLQVFSIKRWGLLGFAGVAALAFRWRPRWDLVAGLVASTAVLTFVYIVTPRDLNRHLATSLERVAIAPMGLLALSLVTAVVPKSLSRGLRR